MASLKDDGLTPAQQYREALKNMSEEERNLQLLESKWTRSLKKWSEASVMVQALMRGWWVRRMLRQTKARNAVIHMTEKMVNQAGAHLNDGRHEKAVDLASEAIVLDDGYSHAYVVRAHAKYAQQQFEPAAEDYSVAIAREPKNREALHGRARCYGSLEQWDSAIRDVNHLMDAQPDNPDHWALRAMLRSKLRLWALAAQDMTTFMEKGSRNVKALIQRGSCYAADQDWHSALRFDSAVNDYETALKIDKHSQAAQEGLDDAMKPHNPLPLNTET